MEKYGTLIEGYNLKKSIFVVMAFVFMFRRAFIIQLIFLRSENIVIQLCIVLIMQLIYSAFLCSVRPYDSRLNNNMELFNECFAIYILFLFQLLNDTS